MYSLTDTREHLTSTGVAFRSTITRDGRTVGAVENHGDGGANIYRFHSVEARAAFRQTARQAASDTPDPEAAYVETLNVRAVLAGTRAPWHEKTAKAY